MPRAVRPPDENNLPVRPTGKKESVRNWRIEMGVQRARSTFSPISDGFLLSSVRRARMFGRDGQIRSLRIVTFCWFFGSREVSHNMDKKLG